MDPNYRITLALTHFNRFGFLLESVAQVINDPRIGEVVISDDASTDGSYQKLQTHFKDHPKVRLFRNTQNLDCYMNKMKAVQRTRTDWLILFDSDNVLEQSYLDLLYQMPKWDPSTIYAPDFARPAFDYTAFSGLTIDSHNVASYMGVPVMKMVNVRGHMMMRPTLQPHESRFRCALNTCNYFVHRESYLTVFDPHACPVTADSIYQIYNWLRSGRRFQFVKGLNYFHRIHGNSHYKLNVRRTGTFHQDVERKLIALR